MYRSPVLLFCYYDIESVAANKNIELCDTRELMIINFV